MSKQHSIASVPADADSAHSPETATDTTSAVAASGLAWFHFRWRTLLVIPLAMIILSVVFVPRKLAAAGLQHQHSLANLSVQKSVENSIGDQAVKSLGLDLPAGMGHVPHCPNWNLVGDARSRNHRPFTSCAKRLEGRFAEINRTLIFRSLRSVFVSLLKESCPCALFVLEFAALR